MSDERMREALEAAIKAIEGLADQQAMPDDFYKPLLQKAREALSPPARRTSYEWVDRAGFTHRVRWGRWGPSANDGWRVEFWGDNGWSAPVPSSRELSVLAAAIATLAGLEKEEERSVPSVRSVLAKHGLIDKVPTSGEEIERACRSSEQEGEE